MLYKFEILDRIIASEDFYKSRDKKNLHVEIIVDEEKYIINRWYNNKYDKTNVILFFNN